MFNYEIACNVVMTLFALGMFSMLGFLFYSAKDKPYGVHITTKLQILMEIHEKQSKLICKELKLCVLF